MSEQEKPLDNNGDKPTDSKENSYFLGRGPNYQPPPMRDFSEAADPKIEHPVSQNPDTIKYENLKRAAIHLSNLAEKIFGNEEARLFYDPNAFFFTIPTDEGEDYFGLARIMDEIKVTATRREYKAANVPTDAYSVSNMIRDEKGTSHRSFYFNKEGQYGRVSAYSLERSDPNEQYLYKSRKFYIYKSPGDYIDFEYASHEINRLLTALEEKGIQIDPKS